jgi:transposase InsO family protein
VKRKRCSLAMLKQAGGWVRVIAQLVLLRLPENPGSAESRGLESGEEVVYCLYREEALTHAMHRRERFRPTPPNHVWWLDFVADQLAEGRRFRTLTVPDVFTRESLAIGVG